MVRFVLITRSPPAGLVEDLNHRLAPSAVEVLHLPRLDRVFRRVGQDVSIVGALVLPAEHSDLAATRHVVAHLLRKDPLHRVVVAARDGEEALAFQRLLKDLSPAVDVGIGQDPAVLAAGLYWALAKRTQLQQREAATFRARWTALARGFGRALQLRDRVTQLHSVGVMAICKTVAPRLPAQFRLPRDLRFQLRIGAIMHDVGKVAVPERILTKPDALDEVEWLAMRAHPEEGLRDVLDISGFRQVAGGLRGARRFERILRHFTWPLVVLFHHWFPRYPDSRSAYPAEISDPTSVEYLGMLGWKDGDDLSAFLCSLFDHGELLPGLWTGTQLRTVWALARCADIIDARLYPRPYHRTATSPSLDQVLRDLEDEAGRMARQSPAFRPVLEAVARTLRANMTAIASCLDNRGAERIADDEPEDN